MWTHNFSKTFHNLKQKDVWDVMIDVNNWPRWHDDLEYSKLNDAFAVGSYFMLKPKGIRAVKIMLTEINPGYSFTDCTNFLGAKMFDTHTVHQNSDGLTISNTLVVTGPLSWLWIRLVANKVADSVPSEIEALVKLVRNTYGK